MTEALAPVLAGLLDRGQTAVLVTITAARGSTPRAAGTRMLVTAAGVAGTIGGGALEWHAINQARALPDRPQTLELPLGPALGQCCGGTVSLALEPADAATLARLRAAEQAERQAETAVLLFGAGHVGAALAAALAPLPFRLTWIDSRADALPPDRPARVAVRLVAAPDSLVAEAPAAAAYLVMTHDHDLDFAITEAVLRRGDALYCGLIGSKTKRRRFERRFLARGGDPAALPRLTCPIAAGPVTDKRPAVIAALAAAELLRVTLAPSAAPVMTAGAVAAGD